MSTNCKNYGSFEQTVSLKQSEICVETSNISLQLIFNIRLSVLYYSFIEPFFNEVSTERGNVRLDSWDS